MEELTADARIIYFLGGRVLLTTEPRLRNLYAKGMGARRVRITMQMRIIGGHEVMGGTSLRDTALRGRGARTRDEFGAEKQQQG